MGRRGQSPGARYVFAVQRSRTSQSSGGRSRSPAHTRSQRGEGRSKDPTVQPHALRPTAHEAWPNRQDRVSPRAGFNARTLAGSGSSFRLAGGLARCSKGRDGRTTLWLFLFWFPLLAIASLLTVRHGPILQDCAEAVIDLGTGRRKRTLPSKQKNACASTSRRRSR